MTILRVYDPEECTAEGVPLDWERCRNCEGVGWTIGAAGICDEGQPPPCGVCLGYGSLKAAALASRLMRFRGSVPIPAGEIGHRCESCSHPMSEGTWEGSGTLSEILMTETLYCVERDLREGREPPRHHFVHYSPCDEGCRHGGPTRIGTREGWCLTNVGPQGYIGNHSAEASWRPVDVRTLGWPHDLRPEKLATLCLRCFAERSAG